MPSPEDAVMLAEGNPRAGDSRSGGRVTAAGIATLADSVTLEDSVTTGARTAAGIVILAMIVSTSPHLCCSGGLRQ
jgi:hypothetical protein